LRFQTIMIFQLWVAAIEDTQGSDLVQSVSY
jgi:hypothetical protein